MVDGAVDVRGRGSHQRDGLNVLRRGDELGGYMSSVGGVECFDAGAV